MFDDILTCLLNEDTSGYPIPGNADLPDYTLEGKIVDMLYEVLDIAEGAYIKMFTIDMINALVKCDRSWAEIIKEMEEFEE